MTSMLRDVRTFLERRSCCIRLRATTHRCHEDRFGRQHSRDGQTDVKTVEQGPIQDKLAQIWIKWKLRQLLTKHSQILSTRQSPNLNQSTNCLLYTSPSPRD